jgi:hypothetical protein
LNGAKIFHTSDDPRVSVNAKVGCASCHPQAQQDGRSWESSALPGPHGPRETTSLLNLGRTFRPMQGGETLGQLHRSGDRDEVQDFEHTFQGVTMGGTGFLGASVNPELGAPNGGIDQDLDDLANYLLALEPIARSPYRNNDGSLSEAAIRGVTFFVGNNRPQNSADAGCADCHVPETGFVDHPFHDVGQQHGQFEEELNNRAPLWGVNTATLLGVWFTPPYQGVSNFASTTIIGVLVDMVSRANHNNNHGTPDGLTRRQLATSRSSCCRSMAT